MKSLFSLSLTQKIILFLLVGLGANVLLLIHTTEEALEEIILDQTKQQVHAFLLGLEREIHALPDLNDRTRLDALLKDPQLKAHENDLSFAVEEMYVFDTHGRVLGHTEPGPHPDKPMENSYYGQVIQTGLPYVSQTKEVKTEGPNAEMIAVVDVIVPLHRQGAVVGGIEAEINLLETMRLIKATDDAYETEITRMLSVNAIILFAMLWWMIHHLLVRRVNQYDQVTRKIAAGEFSSRIASPMAQDELGRLGQSVNYMAESIEQLLHEQEESYLQMLRSLAKALETKDAYTATHSSRVSKYAFRLGQHLGLPAKKLALLKKGALMHDLGKIGIADAILNKPGPLTDDEFAIMKSHPVKTAAIMRPLTRFKEFAEIAAWHHERWDGKGYPDGLQGEAVPLLARVVSIADTWDAMTGDRVYRKGMPETKALSIMEREQDDGQWDPTLIRAFIAMVKEEQTATESQADPT